MICISYIIYMCSCFAVMRMTGLLVTNTRFGAQFKCISGNAATREKLTLPKEGQDQPFAFISFLLVLLFHCLSPATHCARPASAQAQEFRCSSKVETADENAQIWYRTEECIPLHAELGNLQLNLISQTQPTGAAVAPVAKLMALPPPVVDGFLQKKATWSTSRAFEALPNMRRKSGWGAVSLILRFNMFGAICRQCLCPRS